MDTSNGSLHAQVPPEGITSSFLESCCIGELGQENLDGCKYAFQMFDIKVLNDPPGGDMDNDSSDSEDNKYKPPATSPCIVYMFGIDCDGRSVTMIIDDFTPFFFIETNWVSPTVNRTDATRKLRFKMEKSVPYAW